MLSDDRFNGLQAFVAVAEAGSFTVAGERLSLSRSAVGKSIAKLERRLGTRLFHRTTRSLRLTDEGRTFHASCVRALAELEKGETALAARKGAPSGRVRIDLPVSFGQRWVVPILLELAERHAALRFDISFSNRRTDFVREGADLKIRIGTLGDDGTTVARYLGVQKRVLCAAPAYLDRHGRPHRVADVQSHDSILDRRGTRAWCLTTPDGKVQSVNLRSRLCFDRVDAVADAALAGQGVARLPSWLVAEHLASGALEEVLPGHSIEVFPIHVLWLGRAPLPLKTRVVVDALVERFLPIAPWERGERRLHPSHS
ncbi:LysR family transcriptional regulator [Pendulispora albinea]|uniref:LysR family transcriptional regulator n=1 Tax=Pendulispora albinea TaxID=2741071 RepID=A0ABZ2LMN4_9BACT